MNKILLTGANGQVGWELARSLAPLGEVIARNRATLDLTDSAAVAVAIKEVRPDIVVNAAAYTAVDQAEREPDLAMKINAEAPAVMAEAAQKLGSLLVHYSTDYVFDGVKQGAYTEEDMPNPLGIYGRSKLAGEQAIQLSGCRHLIFRTSWVYGLRGKNFLRTIQRLAGERNELSIVDDQVGAPTWSRMIAKATALALRCDPESGIYHLTAAGATSWHGFAKAILEAQQWGGKLTAISTDDYPLPAKRPANSRLNNAKLASALDLHLPDWHRALRLCLPESSGRL